MWLKDPSTGEKSPSLTFFAVGFTVALFKLLFSGVEIGEFVLQPFSGADFAAVSGAVGAIYASKRFAKNNNSKGDKLEK